MSAAKGKKNTRRILGRVSAERFVGRSEELDQIVRQPHRPGAARGLLLLLAPSAGVSELLRQSYDRLFNQRGPVVPIYFAFSRSENTAVSSAIEFLNTFLIQYIAFRRNQPALAKASLTLNDLAQLAPAADSAWIAELIEVFNRERFNNDERALVRFCFSAPQRVPARHARPFVMIDAAQFVEHLNGRGRFGAAILRDLTRTNLPFLFAGLRRQALAAAHRAGIDFAQIDILRLERLTGTDAQELVNELALRQQVTINDETRALLVHQFDASPFLISSLTAAARDRNVSLSTYLDCEQLYVDELLGGRVAHNFSSLLEEIAPRGETRRALLSLLSDKTTGKSSTDTWRQRLEVEVDELQRILHALHVHELINREGDSVEILNGPPGWNDYLGTRVRLEIEDEPRALVVAETLAAVLKRAPQAMAREYRQSGNLNLRQLLSSFNCQQVPKVLFDSDAFAAAHKGSSASDVAERLNNDANLRKLPQVVHVASGQSFDADLQTLSDEERCMVAHSFADALYTDAKEAVWLVAEIESKLSVGGELAEFWCEHLESLAARNGFVGYQLWLISNEGFSEAARDVLKSHNALSSSRQQVELLTNRLGIETSTLGPASDADEFVMILPMGEDNELLAASTVEQIARRLKFRPEAINQIKTAIVEACINAAEHSFSPDRKIYQRFRVESDRLVVTIASRGVVPANIDREDQAQSERRGWGLKMIRTLMDEVEFESVDEGTSLRMTKYLRE